MAKQPSVSPAKRAGVENVQERAMARRPPATTVKPSPPPPPPPPTKPKSK